MVSIKSFMVFVLFLALPCIPVLGANDPLDAVAQGGKAVSHPRMEAFRSALEANGFIVRDGATKKVDIAKLVDERYLDSAAGNNAGQFYKRFAVPTHPASEYRTDAEIATGQFRMNPDEALIYIGATPPPCDYFSFCPFLFVRHYPDSYEKGNWLFASIGDPLNAALLKTDGPGHTARITKNTMVIFVTDTIVYKRIERIARSSGFPQSMINCYVIPSSVLNLGTSPESDTLLILLRTANFRNQTKGDAYLDNDHYATVYRVTPSATPDILQPFDYPPARNRELRPEGGELNPKLQAGLERLKAAILAKTPNASYKAYESMRWFYDSRDVLKEDPSSPAYRQFVAGESSDTPYLRITENGTDPANFILGDNDMAVVYGVNHAATGLATYSSFGVYGEWKTNLDCAPFYFIGCDDYIWNGVASMTSHKFAGSAQRYIPGDPMARYLYAVRLVRGDCPKGDKYCVSVPVPTKPWWLEPTTPGSADGIGKDQPALIAWRAYLNPKTKSGPSYDDIIPDRAIWFNLH